MKEKSSKERRSRSKHASSGKRKNGSGDSARSRKRSKRARVADHAPQAGEEGQLVVCDEASDVEERFEEGRPKDEEVGADELPPAPTPKDGNKELEEAKEGVGLGASADESECEEQDRHKSRKRGRKKKRARRDWPPEYISDAIDKVASMTGIPREAFSVDPDALAKSKPNAKAKPAISTPRVAEVAHNALAESAKSKAEAWSRKNRRHTPEQTRYMEECFAANPLPSPEEKEQIASKVGTDKRTVTIWYQNKRARVKRSNHRSQSASVDPSSPDSAGGTGARADADADLEGMAVVGVDATITTAPPDAKKGRGGEGEGEEEEEEEEEKEKEEQQQQQQKQALETDANINDAEMEAIDQPA
jgi:hypothetical protein